MSELGLSGKIQYIRQSIKKSLSRRQNKSSKRKKNISHSSTYCKKLALLSLSKASFSSNFASSSWKEIHFKIKWDPYEKQWRGGMYFCLRTLIGSFCNSPLSWLAVAITMVVTQDNCNVGGSR